MMNKATINKQITVLLFNRQELRQALGAMAILPLLRFLHISSLWRAYRVYGDVHVFGIIRFCGHQNFLKPADHYDFFYNGNISPIIKNMTGTVFIPKGNPPINRQALASSTKTTIMLHE